MLLRTGLAYGDLDQALLDEQALEIYEEIGDRSRSRAPKSFSG
jgi:hypothetical protein